MMNAIGALLPRPASEDGVWRAARHAAVDALEAIERPFAL
jgi:hypothetical protein